MLIGRCSLRAINGTNLVLISKRKNPRRVVDFHFSPYKSCKVLFKMKTTANITIMSSVIVSGRLIIRLLQSRIKKE